MYVCIGFIYAFTMSTTHGCGVSMSRFQGMRVVFGYRLYLIGERLGEDQKTNVVMTHV